MLQRTALYPQHLEAHATCVPFAGWEMPLHYGSQIEEHVAVRQSMGIFDVSHMTQIDVCGPEAKVFLQHLLANDAGKLNTPGKALYSCMLNEEGGIIDDLIVYLLESDRYRLVVNAATKAKDWSWLTTQIQNFQATLALRPDLSMLAIQGPEARTKLAAMLPALSDALLSLKPFYGFTKDTWLVGRTGYTGEDGVECMLPHVDAQGLWSALISCGAQPCGLGARDTLRLEAGLNLYGQDMNEQTLPHESNLTWTVAMDPARDFIGKAALTAYLQTGVQKQLVGVVLDGRGVLRKDQAVYLPDGKEGVLTSGTFSPTLQKGIGLARIPISTAQTCEVDIRGTRLAAKIVTPPFVRQGKKLV